MKLDLDCMRDTLLWLEDREYGEASDAGQMIAALSKYSADTVRYTVQKLNEAEFINADIYGMINGGIEFSVKDITYNGHQFLADVRSPKLWQLCKKVLEELEMHSVHSAAKVAFDLATRAISISLASLMG